MKVFDSGIFALWLIINLSSCTATKDLTNPTNEQPPSGGMGGGTGSGTIGDDPSNP
jgi:hypothetical protein